jgi:hypothetical protein
LDIDVDGLLRTRGTAMEELDATMGIELVARDGVAT